MAHQLEPILDTHQHLIDIQRWPYTWASGVAALAGKAFDYDAYVRAAAGTGIAGSIFMETTPDDPCWRDEARIAYALANDPDSLVVGVIARAELEASPADFQEYLASIDSDNLVGLRRILHVEPDGLSATPDFRSNLSSLAGTGLTFDLCVKAEQIPIAIELAKACPSVQFVLDHCGNPQLAKGDAREWRDAIERIAKWPNVACKISGLAANAQPEHINAATLAPYVTHCINSFGWDRVVWGSDWPVCNISTDLTTWVRVTREIVADAKPADRADLFRNNAIRLYGLSGRAAKLKKLGLI